jgi:predicted DCC family thiol-disulfide oxidoreductase YuxK
VSSDVATIFYDGDCGLCHRAVRIVLAADPEGRAFRFAPLGGETFRALVPEATRAQLPDSIVLREPDGTLHVRTAALRAIARRLGGRWKIAAALTGVLPSRLLDAGYDGVARVRHRLFAKPPAACPVLPPELRARFDP